MITLDIMIEAGDWSRLEDAEALAQKAELVRLLASDRAILERWADPKEVSRDARGSISLAYAQETDPDMRGAVAWLALQPETEVRLPALVLPLSGDLRSGRATLPGDTTERIARAAYVYALATEPDIVPALLVTAGGAAALLLVVLVLWWLGRVAIA